MNQDNNNMVNKTELETEGTDSKDTHLETSTLSKEASFSGRATSFILRFFPSFVSRQLAERPGIRKILANVSWLSGERVLGMVIGVSIGALVARYLGPEKFGILNYAAAFVGLFSVLSSLGLDGIVVRELVKHPEEENEILGSAFILALLGGTLAFILAVATSFLLLQDRPLVRWMVVILAIGLIVQAVRPIDLWFRSQVLSKYVVFARSGSLVFISATKIGLVLESASLIPFAIANVGQTVLSMFGLLIAFRKKGKYLMHWRPKFARAVRLINESWPLIISGFAITIYMKIDQVMLGQMVGDKAVGTYAAAVRLSVIWYFIPMAIASSVLPAIVKSKELGGRIYKKRLQKYYDVNAILAYSLVIPTTFLAPIVVRLLYGSAYASTGNILAIHIWASIFVFLGVARGQYLVTEGLLKFSAWATITGAIVNVTLNYLLIPRYAGIGAAIATVVSQAVSAYVSSFFYPRLFETALMQTKALYAPIRYIFALDRRNR